MKQRGFTLIELMIATVVFTLLLLLCTTAAIYIGRQYYKGISSSRAQEAARNVMEEISRGIQLSNESVQLKSTNPLPGDTYGAVCVGTTRYIYVKDQRVVTDPFALWKDDQGRTCESDPASVIPANGQEILPNGMRLQEFYITKSSSGESYEIDIKILYGADDVITAGKCNSTSQGGQFCGVAGLHTTVSRRVD